MFTHRDDGLWISHLGPDLLMEMALILYFEGDVEKNPWRQIKLDMLDALTVLAADVASMGVSQDILDRLPRGELRSLPFLMLPHECDDLVCALRELEACPPEFRKQHARRVLTTLAQCREYASKVIAHLETHGVSVHLVYRLEKIGAILDRIESIVRILVPHDGLLTVREVTSFTSRLVSGVHDDKSIRELVQANLRQLSRKLVERTGDTGEQAIVRTRADYLHIFRGAAGGGFLTLFTAILKVVTTGLGLPLFIEGFALAMNYAGSFLLMQFVGFKLATKQPALFAAAIAGKLLKREYVGDSAGFVSEVARITRSQTAAVAGNIGLIIPCAIVFDQLWRLVRGHPFLEVEAAQYAVSSLDPFASGTLFFAALTGVILMMSSLVGSWVENFVVFRRIPEAIARNRRFQRAFGIERTAGIADWFLRNVSGIGICISLGFLLGMTPAVGKVLGLPLDVRHVTLSAGQLSLGVSALGLDALLSWNTAFALFGVMCIGLLNFGVSFVLALGIALRAREVSVPAAFLLVRDVARAFARRPAEFLLPGREPRNPAAHAAHLGAEPVARVEPEA
jgi:site-specific recombinase